MLKLNLFNLFKTKEQKTMEAEKKADKAEQQADKAKRKASVAEERAKKLREKAQSQGDGIFKKIGGFFKNLLDKMSKTKLWRETIKNAASITTVASISVCIASIIQRFFSTPASAVFAKVFAGASIAMLVYTLFCVSYTAIKTNKGANYETFDFESVKLF